MQKKSTLSFAISQEEVFVALHYLNHPSMAGLDNSVLNELSDKEKNLVLGVAERAMIARGFLIRNSEHRLMLSAPVFACLSACAEPDKSMVIQRTFHNGHEENYFIHAARKMRVIHTLPLTSIHQFIAVEDDSALNKAILSIMKMNGAHKAECDEFIIDMPSLNRIRDLAGAGKVKDATDILNKQINDKNTSSALAKAFSKPVSSTTVAFVAGKEATGFSVFESKDHLWLMKPADESETSDKIIVRPVGSGEVAKEVTHWFHS